MTASSTARVVLKPRKARPFFAGHPWVFGVSVARVDGAPAPGDEVAVHSHEGAFIARGLFNPASTILARLYRWQDASLDDAFWQARIESSVRLRTETLALESERAAYRLVFSEGDGLSGLVVDRYDCWLVVQFSSLALHARRAAIVGALRTLTGCQGLVVRPDRATAALEGLSRQDVELVGSLPAGPVAVVENGLTYEIDLAGGQKTGFYCDQRENRRAVAAYCARRRVLDLFCYTGGFSLNALRHGGAAATLGIDSSAHALAQARRNAGLNGLDHAVFEGGDVLQHLERLAHQADQFDVVVCDPPKYAGQARDRDAALRGYQRLNVAALRVLSPGGILATCSCSGHVDRASFITMLGLVAEESGRPIQILEQRGQAADHPVQAACPESDYLKCVVCRVE